MVCKNMDANTCLSVCIFARAIPGKCGIGLRSGYCGAKAAVLGWMDALRAEEAALGTGRPDGNAQIRTRSCPRPSLPPCSPSLHLNHTQTYDDRIKNPECMPGLSQDTNLKQCPHRRRQQIWSHGPQHFHRLACRILVRACVRAFVLVRAAPLHAHAHVQYRVTMRVYAWGHNASCCLFAVCLGVQLPAPARSGVCGARRKLDCSSTRSLPKPIPSFFSPWTHPSPAIFPRQQCFQCIKENHFSAVPNFPLILENHKKRGSTKVSIVLEVLA